MPFKGSWHDLRPSLLERAHQFRLKQQRNPAFCWLPPPRERPVVGGHDCRLASSEAVSATAAEKPIWINQWRQGERNSNLRRICHMQALCVTPTLLKRQPGCLRLAPDESRVLLLSVPSLKPGASDTEKEMDTVPALNLFIGTMGTLIPTSDGFLYIKGEKICKAFSMVPGTQ